MTNIQILALAAPVVIVAIAAVYTAYLRSQKPPNLSSAPSDSPTQVLTSGPVKVSKSGHR